LIRSVDEHEDRQGQSLKTQDHEVIRKWAEERGAKPVVVEGTQAGEGAGVLRFDFPGYEKEGLREVSWEQWLKTFDEKKLTFLYQEHLKNGKQSNFFKLDNAQ